MEDEKENIIVTRSFDFAVTVYEFAEMLHKEKKFVFANQLFKSGTSIGANIKEAQNAESRKDFIHKMKIAAKEADETEYWLDLAIAVKYPANDLLTKCNEIQRILTKIITTSKSKL